jgi:hypothetical protein
MKYFLIYELKGKLFKAGPYRYGVAMNRLRDISIATSVDNVVVERVN